MTTVEINDKEDTENFTNLANTKIGEWYKIKDFALNPSYNGNTAVCYDDGKIFLISFNSDSIIDRSFNTGKYNDDMVILQKIDKISIRYKNEM